MYPGFFCSGREAGIFSFFFKEKQCIILLISCIFDLIMIQVYKIVFSEV